LRGHKFTYLLTYLIFRYKQAYTDMCVVCFSHEYRQKLTASDVITIFLQLHAFVHLCIRKQLKLLPLYILPYLTLP